MSTVAFMLLCSHPCIGNGIQAIGCHYRPRHLMCTCPRAPDLNINCKSTAANRVIHRAGVYVLDYLGIQRLSWQAAGFTVYTNNSLPRLVTLTRPFSGASARSVA